MAPQAYMIIRDTSGVEKSRLTLIGSAPNVLRLTDQGASGLLKLAWSKKRNAVDQARFMIPYDHPDRQYIIDKYICEIYRCDKAIGLDWYKSFNGIIRDEVYTETKGKIYLTVTALGAAHMLSWRINAYFAGLLNRAEFNSIAAETLIKTLGTYNLTSSAHPTNLRDRIGTITGFSIQADSAGGFMLSISASRDDLLTTLQKLIVNANGDFSVAQLTANTYELRYHANQLGTDRSATVLFSLDRANMANPKLEIIRSTEKTVAIVGGADEGPARLIQVVTGANYHVTNNNIEMFVDANNVNNVDVLESLGEQALKEKQARYKLTYDVLQTSRDAVERDYFLGDRVKAKFANYTVTQWIDALSFEYDHKSGETVKVDTIDYT